MTTLEHPHNYYYITSGGVVLWMCYCVCAALLLLRLCSAVTKPEFNAQQVTHTLSTILHNYDAKIRPGYPGPPVVVQVNIAILGLGLISESRMEFSLHCYFRQKWKDPRLQFDELLAEVMLSGQHNQTMDDDGDDEGRMTYTLPLNAERVLNEIWRPDTYIRNGKHSYLHQLTVPNRLLRIRSDGMVLLSQRLTITARCLMQLKRFPMDRQNCELQIGSLGYATPELVYRWARTSVQPPTEVERLSQFELIDIVVHNDDAVESVRKYENSSVLTAVLVLQRTTGYYVLQIYVPCSMIVMLSWVSFWINQEAAIARCSLGVMTVMTLTTLRLGVREEFPPVHYPTAIDIFLLVSFGFVLAALVEYIVIHYTHLVHVRKVKALREKTSSFLAQPLCLTASKSPRSFRQSFKVAAAARQQLTSSNNNNNNNNGNDDNNTHSAAGGQPLDPRVRLLTGPSSVQRRSAPASDKPKLGALKLLSGMAETKIELNAIKHRDSSGGLSAEAHEEYQRFQKQLQFLRARVHQMTQMSMGGGDAEECGAGGGEDGGPRQPVINDRVTRRIRLVDSWAKVVFPAAYILFHVCYWLFYIFYEDDE